MITCQACEEIISTMLDGEASREECRTMYEHLAGCEQCEEFMKDAIAMQATIASRGIRTLPDTEVARLADRSDSKPVPGSRARIRNIIRKRIPVPVPMLGSAVILIGVILYVIAGIQRTPPVEQQFHATRSGLSTVAFPVDGYHKRHMRFR